MIAVIALIVLGPTRLPDAARSVGRGMREMRDSFHGLTGDDQDDEDFEDDAIVDDPDSDSEAAPAASPGRS